jgi:hypothetical protein
MTVIVVQQIDDTHDYNFIYNNRLLAVALLTVGEYSLHFCSNIRGYSVDELEKCVEGFKQIISERERRVK